MFWILFTKKGKRRMVELYCALIIAERRTIDQILPRYKEAVIEELKSIGLDENGNPINYQGK